jgi:hypothetical protein
MITVVVRKGLFVKLKGNGVGLFRKNLSWSEIIREEA